MSSDPIKVVLFSVDETLFDWQCAFEGGIQQVMLHFPSLANLELEDVVYRYLCFVSNMEPMQQAIITGSLTSFNVDIFLRALDESLPAGCNSSQCEAFFMDGYARNGRHIAHAQETIRALESSGFMVAVLTRHWCQFNTLRDLGYFNNSAIKGIFNHTPESGHEVDTKAFQQVAGQIGVDPWNILVVGQLDEHTAGALGALCRFIAVDRAGLADQYCWEDRVAFKAIRDLKNLPELLLNPDLITWRISIEGNADVVGEYTPSSNDTVIARPSTLEPPAWGPITFPPKDQESYQTRTPEHQSWKPMTPNTGTTRFDGQTSLGDAEGVRPGSPKPPIWSPITPETGHC